jgi:hypothetical protein
MRVSLGNYGPSLNSQNVGTYKAEGPCVKRRLLRWRSPMYPGMACLKSTRSQAKGWFKEQLGVKELPKFFKLETY